MPENTNATILNLGATNGADPAPPETEEERNKALQGDLDLAERKAEEFKERESKAKAFLQGQDDSDKTAKPTIVSNSQPTTTGGGTSGTKTAPTKAATK